MAKVNQAGMKMMGMEGQTLKSAPKAVVSKKMAPSAVAKRKKTMVSNAAGKLMGGLYSK